MIWASFAYQAPPAAVEMAKDEIRNAKKELMVWGGLAAAVYLGIRVFSGKW
jgi:hypothetical protein